jgi:hypothetical protein
MNLYIVPMFLWYHSNGDGSASVHFDSPAIRARVDSESDWYGSVEGAIKHGGVVATAFIKRTEPLYDAITWLKRNERLPVGVAEHTEITAERKVVWPNELD